MALRQAHNEDVNECVARPPLSPAILGAVGRATARTATVIHQELQADVNTLATIAAVAPWLGLLATVVLIFESFRSVAGDKTSDMLWTCGWLSLSLWPTAMGLAVGLISLWCFRHLTSR